MKLYGLYQTHIRGHSKRALQTAHRLAQQASKSLSEKEFKRLQRREAFGEAKARNWFRAILVQMTEKGDLDLEDYIDLFPYRDGQGITVEWDGWNLISFYLHHADEDFPKIAGEFERTNKIHPYLFYYAAKIYNHYISKRGEDQFQKEILAHMGRKVGVPWIRSQFVQLAESEDGFSYGDWSRLCKLESGELLVWELLFQMRMLWVKWSEENRKPMDVSKPNEESTDGLPQHIRILIETLFADYVNRRGLDRFQRDVLQRLRRREIGLGWFHKKLTQQISSDIVPLAEEEWEEFLLDDQQGFAIPDRLFQLHLTLANLLRKRAAIEHGGILQ